ncbi:ACP S-malonyltransferase [Balneolaceae bacterium ANBcel3]|nr:ACP S-malonyltransferase [Balneolaceae bacterium ANBcel3]
MKKAYVFPGQGSQYKGMGADSYRFDPVFKKRCDEANEIIGYRITDIMFAGSEEELMQTKFTQPALFLHAIARFESLGHTPDMVAGHSLGEYTALAASGSLSFEDALKAVKTRGELMQEAGEKNPGAMAAVIGLSDEVVEEICVSISEEGKELVQPANYNADGQVVISGSENGVVQAMEKLRENGARMVKLLPVSGAFHTNLMEPANKEMEEVIDQLTFNNPVAPVYSNVTAEASSDPDTLKLNLKKQMLNPVRWTQTLRQMQKDGALHFVEVGAGNVLQGLVKRTLKKTGISGF